MVLDYMLDHSPVLLGLVSLAAAGVLALVALLGRVRGRGATRR